MAPDRRRGPEVTTPQGPSVENPHDTDKANLQAAGLLILSDERDLQLAARLNAWREGYATGSAERFAEGYAAAIADVKRAHHEIVRGVRVGLARSAPAGAAWLAAVVRHNGTEYGGAGRPRVPVPPAVIARAWQEQGGGKQ
jgi:hypothetical protein